MSSRSVDDLLSSLGERESVSTEARFIYGVSSRSGHSFFQRLNDFWIDHQKVPLKEKAYFFHLLSVMLDAGIPMLKSLHILADKTPHERFRRVISTMAHQVEGGQYFSEAMAKFPTVFNEAEVGVVKSGEAIGRLDLMLERLSDQLDRSYNVHLRLRSAFMYPVVVLVVLAIATLIVMTLVVPRLKFFFEQSNIPLPILTRVILVISQFTIHYWWMMSVAVLLLFIALSVYANTRSGTVMMDYWKLKSPFVGDLIRKSLVAKFGRLLGMLISSGLPVHRVLNILKTSMGNSLYEIKLSEVVRHVERGEKISTNLASTPFLFPEMVTQMLAIAESSATLDKACEKLSNHYEREIEYTIKNMMTVLEPLIIVFVGLAVAVLALAILGPVFSLSEIV